jgi:hypothetical protein
MHEQGLHDRLERPRPRAVPDRDGERARAVRCGDLVDLLVDLVADTEVDDLRIQDVSLASRASNPEERSAIEDDERCEPGERDACEHARHDGQRDERQEGDGREQEHDEQRRRRERATMDVIDDRARSCGSDSSSKQRQRDDREGPQHDKREQCNDDADLSRRRPANSTEAQSRDLAAHHGDEDRVMLRLDVGEDEPGDAREQNGKDDTAHVRMCTLGAHPRGIERAGGHGDHAERDGGAPSACGHLDHASSISQ